MNINLGTPYESIIENIMEKGYAGNQTEVIRQALTSYQKQLEVEELQLVDKAVQLKMSEIRSGEKTISYEEVKKKLFKK